MLKVADPYELVELLGQGGMGQVWKAWDRRLCRSVAIKFLSASQVGQEEARSRFQREVLAVSSLNHPHILTVYDCGEFDGQPYLVTEFVEGCNLRQRLQRESVGLEQVCEWTRQCLAGLEAAHSAGILHRDLKPENLLIRCDGYLKIVDFGLAKRMDSREPALTGEHVVGTLGYMSPEQLQGLPLDVRSDLFALGAVVYEMLSGRSAFAGSHVGEVITAILNRPPSPLDSPLWHWLERALAKSPQARFQSAREMLDELPISGSGSGRKAPACEPHRPTLLVMPLRSSEADRDLALGLAEEVINTVGRRCTLKVIARSTAERFRDQDSLQAAAHLGAAWVLEGHLRRSGPRVRLNVTLLRSQDGETLWADRLDAEMQDLFDLEDELTAGVLRKLESTGLMAAAAGQPSQPVARVQTRALELYHAGSRKLNDYLTEAAFVDLQEAVRLEPHYPPALGRLAQAYVLRGLGNAETRQADSQTAQQVAEEALRRDPRQVDALLALSMLEGSALRSNYAGSRRLLRQALQVQPGHSETLSRLANANLMLGNVKAAEALSRHAIQVDPLRPFHYLWLSQALICQGRLLDAAEAAERSLRAFPQDPIAWINVLFMDLTRGKLEEAEHFFHNLQQFVQGRRLPVLQGGVDALLDACRGLPVDPEARPWLRDARGILEVRLTRTRALAVSHQLEAAMRLLRENVAEGWRNPDCLKRDPLLANLLPLPEYQSLILDLERACQADPEFEEPSL